MTVTYIVGDTRDTIARIPDGTVDLILTSPPFLALRSYLPADHPDKHREIGSEATPAGFVDTLLGLTAGWRRILAPHGTLAVELGDTYSGSGGAGGDYADGGMREHQPKFRQGTPRWDGRPEGQVRTTTSDPVTYPPRARSGWPLPKSLSLVPECYRIGLAYGRNPLRSCMTAGECLAWIDRLRDIGYTAEAALAAVGSWVAEHGNPQSPAGRWRVRNVVTWARPNPPVGALGDKFRPSTSDLVIACTSDRRWFDLDAVRTAPSEWTQRYGGGDYRRPSHKHVPDRADGGDRNHEGNPAGAPPLDHWIIPPGGYRGSHYAVYPPELCRIPIEAMCPRRVCRTCGTPSRREVVTEQRDTGRTTNGPKSIDRKHETATGYATRTESVTTTTGWTSCGCPGTDGIRLDGYHRGTGWRPGLVLDPFGGSGTTGLVASSLSRDAILVDLDPRNLDLARERIGMFLVEGEPGLFDQGAA